MTLLDNLTATVAAARSWLAGRQPRLAIVLGSGLAAILDQLEDSISLPYVDLPGLAPSGVAGHAGCLHCGTLFHQPVLIFQGRYHCYEGYSAWQVTAPVRLAAALGCQQLLLTNAAGGIDSAMQPGDFLLVTDHLNMSGENPLRGRPEREFVDLTHLYRHDFYPQLQLQLQAEGINLHAGVLAWMLGPSYETPAEINLLQS
ncbi:MAG: purine-nucleoside phosphorylase, partial [Deltaproteobacteria bacterium]|nr:purine-nucleoside phosphorylase [Deltaproteobacteria bacterium]